MSTASRGGPSDSSSTFRERARLEAERYGTDPWIFVRELLQNARDAGATRVELLVSEGSPSGGAATVLCRDDGEGMSFEHARRYLFALYASSKEARSNQVGKFGVGFWSILRFEPATITIRSRPRAGAGWGVVLDGGLENAAASAPLDHVGTEIVLSRPAGDGGLSQRVYDAVWQSARYLCQRDDPDTPLAITVNGRQVAAEFALPAPSASFRRGRVRGVVGLGPSPRVELFSRGLRVRSAPSLEDLLSAGGRHSNWLRVQFTELPGGLAPQALLESPEVQVMLARSDARDTRALRQLVRLAQKELERLIERHLSAARPLPWWSQLGNWLADRLRSLSPESWWTGLAVLVSAAALTFVATEILEPRPDPSPRPGAPVAQTPGPEVALGQEGGPTQAPAPGGIPTDGPDGVFEDPGGRYDGPSVDTLGPEALEPVGLRYRPSGGRLYFSVLTFSRLAADGSPIPVAVARPVGRYDGVSCGGRCLEVELPFRSRTGVSRIPVPTGHAVVEGSVVMDGQRPRLLASTDGRPLVLFSRPVEGLLRYRTAVTREPRPPPPHLEPAASSLSPELAARARQRRGLPVRQRVDELVALTRQHVAYDASEPTVRRHRELISTGQGFIERALAVGAGDCDVQNGLLTTLLQAAGVSARLAVGHVGERGSVLPWHHAWVEYLDDNRRWRVADASANAAGDPRLPRAALPVAGPMVGDGEGEDEPAASGPLPAAPAAEGPALSPPATLSASPSRWRLPTPSPALALGALAAALGLLTAWFLLGARTRRAFKLEPGAELSKLLRGVLQQPAAFGHIPALFHRPLVPLANGRAISISRARELASRSRLFFTSDPGASSPLVRDALRSGAAVLDHASEEGKVVADALGAVDLDRWAGLIASATNPPLLREVNRVVRRYGDDWVVRGSPGLSGAVATLDLVALGARIPEVRGTRLVLVDVTNAWFEELARYHLSRPRAATFLVLEELARRLDLRAPSRGRLLGVSARDAVMESFSPGGR